MKTTVLLIIIMLLFALPSALGCRSEMPSICNDFYSLAPQEQATQFRTYPIEKQLEIYRCEMRRKPPNLGRAYDIASGGEKTIPILLEQLSSEKDEHIVSDLIYIFRIMSRDGYLDHKKEVVEQLRQAVSGIKFYRTRQAAQESLDEIETNAKAN